MLERKSAELTSALRHLNEKKAEYERLRRVMFRAGVNANFDPFQLSDVIEVLDEAEASNKHSQMIVGEYFCAPFLRTFEERSSSLNALCLITLLVTHKHHLHNRQ